MAIEQVKPENKEIEAQVKELAGKDLDVHHVEGKDPNFEYRWINTRKENLEMKKIRGWEVESGKAKIKTLSGSLDSTHTLGDLILAKMPKEKYEKMMAGKKQLGDERRKIAKARFREEGKQLGVKTFDDKE